ncbi:MAG: amino acid ABC transporter permease [Candidatus Bipolaricaulota bacterium]|nr:amino acid ABC transporter permease [Candidatus Bipolaricaulota bacterium]MDW8031033.1 amino acid ABC transporter permease [Candidatus Bipolaricaulota bacterium]
MKWEQLCQGLAEEGFLRLACDIAPRLIQGTATTFQLTMLAIGLGLAGGILLALGRVYGNKLIYWVSTAYVQFVRGTPVLVQLFLIYYGLPTFEIRLDSLTAAIIGLGLNSAAYQAEYFRGAIQSISRGQMLAARAIGMTNLQAIRYVILPQALRIVIPPWSNELIYTLKYSSVAFIIGAPELMATGQIIASRNFRYFEVFLIVAFIYLVCVLIISKLLDIAEQKLKIPGLEMR